MELQQLAYFLAAAETLHFTRAAERLGIAQPTLSLSMQQLEKELGSPLFDRMGRSIRLTAAGTLFRERAAGVLHQISDARQSLADLQGLRTGTLRIGITHILATSLLPDVVARFHAFYPGVQLRVEKLTSLGVETELLAGRLDVGISFAPPDAPQLLPERLFEERVVLALPPRHPLLAHGRPASIPFDRLDHLPLALTTPEFATRQLVAAHAARRGITLDIHMEFNDIDLLLATLRESTANANVGSVLARGAIGAHAKKLVLIPIVQPILTHTAYLLAHRDRHRPAAARELIRLLQESLVRRR